MSKKELDRLFRNKLEDHEISPTDNAWERLQSSLSENKKSSGGLFWKIAAAVLLLMAAGFLIWKVLPVDEGNRMAIDTQVEQTTDSTGNITSVPERGLKDRQKITTNEDSQKLTEETQRNDASPENVKKQPDHMHGEARNNAIKPEKRTGETQIAEKIDKKSNDLPQPDATNTVANASIPQTTVKEEETDMSQKEKNPALTFTIEEFASAKITKREVRGENDAVTTTNEDADKKGLKKLLSIVRSVNEIDGIGQLREAKNELLAINEKPAESK